MLLLLDVQHYGTLAAQVFFGLWLAPLGYLAYKSLAVPEGARRGARRGALLPGRRAGRLPGARPGQADHGVGIPAAFKPHVFEKFAQADATDARQKGGTGLGLNIAKQIVERLGGTIGFSDAPGGGTIFHIELPASHSADATDIDLEAGQSAVRVLLCEDDREAATALRERLLPAGFAVDLTYTAAAAVARADATSYAAVLVNLRLPDGDGISLIFECGHSPNIGTLRSL